MKASVAVLVTFWLIAVMIGAASGASDGEALVMERCHDCHDIQRTCRALGTRDRDVWLETVDRMIGYGMPMDEAEAKVVSGYLAGLAKGAKPICEQQTGE